MIHKQPTLTIEKKQLEVFKNILFDAKEYYRKLYNIEAYENLNFISQTSEAYLKYYPLDLMYNNVKNKLEKEFYTCNYKLQPIQCFTLLCSILPTNNNEYTAKIKELVLEYCITVLKYYNLILQSATFKPVLPELEITGYINPSTTINDFLQS
jgi:hypothetical protein